MKKVYAVLSSIFVTIGITLLIMTFVLTDDRSSAICLSVASSAAVGALACCVCDSYYKLVDRVTKLEETSNRLNE